MSTLLFTGFPGFLGSELLPRVLAAQSQSADSPGATCLVQPKFASIARERLAQLEAAHPDLAGRVRLVEGDITRADLGLGSTREALGRQVLEVYHLAAVYDLAVPRDLAMHVNVEGTRHVLAFASACTGLRRFHYASTCYVSGRYAGVFREQQLEEGQRFNNSYEETKHLAEVLVREQIAHGLPAIVYRPAIVVGDSRTGATQKYDGPYHTIRWLLRQPRTTVMPLPAGSAATELNVVPSDYVLDGIVRIGALAESVGRTFQLADPAPLTIGEMVRLLASLAGRTVMQVPVPLALARAALRLPGAGRLAPIPSAMLDYTVHRARYDTAQATSALDASGIHCPRFPDYAGRLVEFVRAHPDLRWSAMA